MPASGRERRKTPRFRLHLPLEVRWRESAWVEVKKPASLRDISSSGIYFQLAGELKPGSNPELVLRLPVADAAGAGVVLHCAARVVRVDPPRGKERGVGVAARIDHFRFDLPSTFPPVQRRRSQRILWRAPILITWTDPSGRPRSQAGETEIVNAHGALIRLPATLPVAEYLQVVHARTNESSWARVVWRDPMSSGAGVHVGIELEQPNEDFWGIHIPVYP